MDWVAVFLISIFAILGSAYCFWSIFAAWREVQKVRQDLSPSSPGRKQEMRRVASLVTLVMELGLAVSFVVAACFVSVSTARTQGAVWWQFLETDSKYEGVSKVYQGPNDSQLIVHFAHPPQDHRVVFIDSTYQPIGDADLAEVIGQFPETEDLLLGRTNVTDSGLTHLRRCRDLDSLSLQGLPITDRGLTHLLVHRGLTFLDLSATNITDAGIKSLAAFEDLEELRLCNTRVSDAGLAHLKQHKHLKLLALTDTSVTKQGIALLREALPNCMIERKTKVVVSTAQICSHTPRCSLACRSSAQHDAPGKTITH